MPPTRLLRTSTFRLTVGYFGLFCLSALAVLLVVYLMSARFMDQQTREEIDADLGALRAFYEEGGQGSLEAAVEQRAVMEPGRKAIYGLFGPGGDYVAGNIIDMPDGRPSTDGEVIRFEVEVYSLESSRSRKHEAVAKLMLIDSVGTLVVGRDVRDKAQALRYLLLAIGIGTACMLVLGLICGHVMSRWTLGRIERVNRTTAGIVAGDLSRRIELSGADDEFDELARHLNAMLERIDRLLAGMRQVTDDIAHDLRTPLSRIRSRIELALMQDSIAPETHDLLDATLRDADGLIETFNALLSIARIEAGAQRGEWEAVDLAALAREVHELYEPLAEDKGIALDLASDAAGPALALGNGQLLAQAIANLVDNAIKHTPPGSRVALRTAGGPAPAVEVADDGPGIPVDQRERAKERFVRLDAARSGVPGSGLGLSLVDAVAKLHDGRLELLDNEPGLRAVLSFRPVPAAADERRPPEAAAPAAPAPAPAPAYASRPAPPDRPAL